MVVSPINPIDGNKVLKILEETKDSIPKMIVDESNWEKTAEDILNEITVLVMRLPTIHTNAAVNTTSYWARGTGIKVKCASCEAESYDENANYCPNCGILMEDKRNALVRLC